jgi:hypothetical protein
MWTWIWQSKKKTISSNVSLGWMVQFLGAGFLTEGAVNVFISRIFRARMESAIRMINITYPRRCEAETMKLLSSIHTYTSQVYQANLFFLSAYCPVLYPDPHHGTIYSHSEISSCGVDHADWVTLLPKVLHAQKFQEWGQGFIWLNCFSGHPAYFMYDTGNWAFSCYCYHQHSLLLLFRELCYETLYHMM